MSTFTALNGGSPKAPETVNGGSMAADTMRRRLGSDESPRTGLPSAPLSNADSTTDKLARPTEDATTSAAITADADRGRDRQMTADRDERDHHRDTWPGPIPSAERSAYPPTSYPDVDSCALKRKRSRSSDLQSSAAPARRSEPIDIDHSPSVSPPRDHGHASPKKIHVSYVEAGHERKAARPSIFGSSTSAKDDWGPNYEQAHSAIPSSAVSEVDPLAEGLARAAHQRLKDEERASPEEMDESPVTPYPGGSYAADQHRDGLVHSDPKKRKRNFSNRTKTGCLTCRKRKKKCDEAKPECSNCIRGGFVCAGYPPQRGSWPKPDSKPATVQIESKDPTYIPPGAYGMPQTSYQSPAPTIMPLQKRESLPSYRGQQLRIETPHQRLLSEEDRSSSLPIPSSSSISGGTEGKFSAFSNTSVSNILPTPISARTPHDYLNPHGDYQMLKRVPPLHELTRNEPELPKTTTIPKITMTLDNTSRPNSPPKTAAAVQATAQMALSHTFAAPSRPKREKEEMLSGNPFKPQDKELVQERERCLAALWRFNKSGNPNMGVSPTERARLFKDIVQPSDATQAPSTMALPPLPNTHTGHVGNGVVVEAPFHCEYGYNIGIKDNVFIGRNTTISDSAVVSIGENAYISPNVQIYTSTLSTDPRRRNGALSQQTAQPVVIEQNVFIGANVTILPGVTIGQGSTVGAGSVVTKSIPAQSVAYGNPARLRRKIAFAT